MALIWQLQESIVKQINEDPKAGWEAAMNPQFSNYTVSLQLSGTFLFLIFKIFFHFLLYDDTCKFIFCICFLLANVSSSAQVGQFKYLLGVKPTPRKDLWNTPLITHPKSLKLPSSFDARIAWPQCSTIGRILG